MLQVLTNANGAPAMTSNLEGPMNLTSFYISNANKVQS